MKLIWSPEAISDLIAIREYTADDNPAAAKRIVLDIIGKTAQLLPENPHIGRPGRVPGTRELVIPGTPYIIPYRADGNTMQVLRVYHGARRWPDRF